MTGTQLLELDLDSLPEKDFARVERRAFQLSDHPWQYDTVNEGYRDPDGAPILATSDKDDYKITRQALQDRLWDKANRNPQISTSLERTSGRLAGFGFEISSEISEIQDEIEETEEDPRNRLYSFWPKFVVRALIEGELFLLLTCHKDGFIEVDFIDPTSIDHNSLEEGIIFHPDKSTMPLAYFVKKSSTDLKLVPSIYLARYPDLHRILKADKHYEANLMDRTRNFGKLGGFDKFIVSWDRSKITKRNIGHARTVLGWVEQYENLKRYEIDHKKSSGAYLWEYHIDDRKDWITWMLMDDADKQKTALAAPKSPGSTLVTGPSHSIKAHNPTLANISDSDTDIMHMVTSGLDEPEDISTGEARGTFASVKMSRGPMSDRIADQTCYFEKFIRFDFYGSIFFLKSRLKGFPETFKVERCVGFDKKGNPKFKEVNRRPEKLIDISFPVSEINDYESRARAMFGVKHGSLSDTAGVPVSELVKRLGFGNYRRLRLRYELEKKKYPELIPTVDQESWQENKIEPPRPKNQKQKSANQEE